jgi:DNA-binding response OmpR family regulator
MADRTRVLIVEDDEAMAVALCDGFGYEGFEVLHAKDGARGLRMARDEHPDVMILDVMLPRMTGLDVCRHLREEGDAVPIIMLTARGQELDKVVGLKLGADDYVTKPFSFAELVARVEAVLRRATGHGGSASCASRQTVGELTVDFDRHEASRGDQTVHMTAREFRLLHHLVEHRGEVVTRDALLDAVWGYDAIPHTRTVDTHIAKLRKKIERDPANPEILITVHGVGYKLLA